MNYSSAFFLILKSLCVMLLTAIQINGYAQSDEPLVKGDRAFDNRDYKLALEYYEDARASFPEDPGITRKLAITYTRIGQLNFAAEWFKRTIELGSNDPMDLLRYAESLKALEQYDEAILWYQRFKVLRPNDRRALSHADDYEYYLDLFADTAQYDVKVLSVNSSLPIVGITAFTENTFIVSGINVDNIQTNKGDNEFDQYLDLYNVKWSESKELTSPTPLGSPVNSPWHDGPACFAKANNTLYITRNNDKLSVQEKSGGEDDFQLMVTASKWNGGKWSEPEPLKFNGAAFSCGHAALSADGKTLFFASNKAGGMGGVDIYFCTKNGDGWSDPKNIGPEINTEGNEMFPTIDAQGNLFFASNGLAGLGGLDIFTSRFDNGKWLKPRNMGAPINSASDDFGLLYNTSDRTGFFCSNRNGLGNDDLFYFNHKPIEKTFISAKLRPSVAGADLSGQPVRIIYVNSGNVIPGRVSSRQSILFSGEAGEEVAVYMSDSSLFQTNEPIIVFKIPEIITDPYVNVSTNPVVCKKPEEFKILKETNSSPFQKAKESIQQNLRTTSISQRKPAKMAVDLEALNLSNVFFAYNSSELNKIEQKKLDEVALLMNQHANSRLIIRAFCDSRGSSEYNKKLSLKRAEEVKGYLKKKGIPANRLRIEWFGKDNPVAECEGMPCSENLHQMNRRAELNLVTINP